MKPQIDLDTPIFQISVQQLLDLIESRKTEGTAIQDRIIFIDEVASLTGLKKSTIYQKTCKNLIPHWRRGKRLYFSYNAIIDFIKENM